MVEGGCFFSGEFSFSDRGVGPWVSGFWEESFPDLSDVGGGELSVVEAGEPVWEGVTVPGAGDEVAVR